MSITTITGAYNSPNIYRDLALTNVVVGVSNSACELTGWNIINNDSASVYVKFYNGTSGSIVLGTSVPIKTLQVPAQTTVYLEHNKELGQGYFPAGLSIASVAGLADSNTTVPGTVTYIETYYRNT